MECAGSVRVGANRKIHLHVCGVKGSSRARKRTPEQHRRGAQHRRAGGPQERGGAHHRGGHQHTRGPLLSANTNDSPSIAASALSFPHIVQG